nr:hypothetical protein [Tanacetum cinerariifolium]
CSWCGGSFNDGNYRRCTNVSFENEFVRNPDPISYDETPDFSYPPPQPKHTRVSYVETILTMVMIVHHGYRLSMSRNRTTVKTLIESMNKLLNTMQSLCEMILQREQAANLSTHTLEPSRRFNFICYDYDDDNDDEESTIPLNEIISQIPPSIAITPVLPIMEPEDSLIMGDRDLRTIPEKESDEFIKSSVEDLVPIPSEFKDTSDNDNECDLPFCDDSPLLDVLGGNSVTFSNPLFDANDDLKSMVKVFDPAIYEKLISLTYVRLPFEDRHYFSLKFVIRIFLPYLTYSMDYSLLLSSGSEDTIFDRGISVFSFYSLEPVVSHRSGTFMRFSVYLNILNESPMEI